MPSYSAPLCYSCQNMQGNPTHIGGSGKCSKYDSIPKNIFYEGGNCKYYTSMGDTKKRKK